MQPRPVNRTLQRLPNSAYRPREYLTEKEVDRLIEAAKRRGRNGARDAAAILLAYRHGLRASELCSLKWSQIDLRHGRLHVNRAKGGQERCIRSTVQNSEPYGLFSARALTSSQRKLTPRLQQLGSYGWCNVPVRQLSFRSRSIRIC
jgi:integrase